jgi:hypothetical protein
MISGRPLEEMHLERKYFLSWGHGGPKYRSCQTYGAKESLRSLDTAEHASVSAGYRYKAMRATISGSANARTTAVAAAPWIVVVLVPMVDAAVYSRVDCS